MSPGILAGGAHVLRQPELLELHIEMREHSGTGQRILEKLTQAGFEVVGRPAHAGATDLIFARSAS